MAKFWTKKKENYSKDEKTMQCADFLVRLTKRKAEETVRKPNIENNK